MTTLTEKTITATISGELMHMAKHGGFMVQAGPGGVVWGGCTTTEGHAYSVLNPTGRGEAPITSALPAGTVLYPGDSVVVLSTGAGASANDEAVAIVVVGYAIDAAQMRPPAIGDRSNELIAFLRSTPIYPPGDVLNRIPSVIDIDALPVSWGAWNCAKPTLVASAARFSDFCGELWDGWGTHLQTPSRQHPGYGRAMSFEVSRALVLAASTYPVLDKVDLVYNLVQWGIDLVGAFAGGRNDKANGGHMQARKALIIFSGHVLNAPWVDPDDYLPFGTFQENEAFFDGHEVLGMDAFPWGWRYGYICYSDDLPDYDMHLPIAQWDLTIHQPVWGLQSYCRAVAGTQLGAGLVMELIGRKAEMGVAHAGFLEQWVDKPPASAIAEMAARGVNVSWGEDYAEGGGENMCEEAWKAYHTHS